MKPRITYLLIWGNANAGTERAVYSQAASLRDFADVEVVSCLRDRDAAPGLVPEGLKVTHLVDATGDRIAVSSPEVGLSPERLSDLDRQPSTIVSPRWESAFSALTDLMLQNHLENHRSDVLVTTVPALIPLAVALAPADTLVVHQDHRRSHTRGSSGEPMALFGAMLDAMVFLSEEIRLQMASILGNGHPPMHAIANSIPATVRPRSSLSNPLVLGVGRMTGEKQFGHLITAFASATSDHPEWHLRLIGDGPTSPALARQVRAMGLMGRVSFTGPLADVTEEYAKASMLVMPSRTEGHPLVALEAGAAGVPTIGYDSGPGTVIGHDERGLLVPPNDVGALGASIRRLIEGPELRAQLGQAAHEWAATATPEHVAHEWIQLFERLLRERASWSPEARASRLRRAVERAPHSAESLLSGPATPNRASIADIQAANLSAIGQILRVAGIPHTGLPSTSWARAQIAIRQQDRGTLMTALAADSGGEWMLASPESPLTWYSLADAPAALAMNPVVLAHVRGRGDLVTLGTRSFGAVELEFWRDSEDIPGQFLAPQANARVGLLEESELRPAGPSDFHGVPFLVASSFRRRSISEPGFPIDLVYTWVDGNDPEWRARRDAAKGEMASSAPPALEGPDHAAGDHRFRSRDELRFSLRSIHQFAPWVRRIFVVTDRQRPRWLEEEHPRISIVDHRDIWSDPSALPVFNSHAIETQIHRIDGLAEHFLYANDDFLLSSPVEPSDFFLANGLSKFYLSGVTVDYAGDPEPHIQAARNNRELLASDYGVDITHSLLHIPIGMRRSLLEELQERYSRDFDRTSRAAFRSPTDVSVTSSLYPHFAFVTGRAVPARARYAYVGLGTESLPEQLSTLLRGRPFTFIALGDQPESAYTREEVDEMLEDFFAQFMPRPAPWERVVTQREGQ